MYMFVYCVRTQIQLLSHVYIFADLHVVVSWALCHGVCRFGAGSWLQLLLWAAMFNGGAVFIYLFPGVFMHDQEWYPKNLGAKPLLVLYQHVLLWGGEPCTTRNSCIAETTKLFLKEFNPWRPGSSLERAWSVSHLPSLHSSAPETEDVGTCLLACLPLNIYTCVLGNLWGTGFLFDLQCRVDATVRIVFSIEVATEVTLISQPAVSGWYDWEINRLVGVHAILLSEA